MFICLHRMCAGVRVWEFSSRLLQRALVRISWPLDTTSSVSMPPIDRSYWSAVWLFRQLVWIPTYCKATVDLKMHVQTPLAHVRMWCTILVLKVSCPYSSQAAFLLEPTAVHCWSAGWRKRIWKCFWFGCWWVISWMSVIYLFCWKDWPPCILMVNVILMKEKEKKLRVVCVTNAK